VSGREYQVSDDVNDSHKLMPNDIKMFGYVLGTIQVITKMKTSMTTAEALGQGDFWECTTDESHLPFQSEKAI
jgi:hypothetical protein